jgi:hypothetical protein
MFAFSDTKKTNVMRKIFGNCFLKTQVSYRLPGMLLLLACGSSLSAQAGVGSAGGHATSEEISFSYSVGQVFNNVISNSEYYVSQGIQHPKLLVISETPVYAAASFDLKVYPNPATDALHVESQSGEQGDYQVLLMNMQGQVLINKTFESNAFVLPLESVGAGSYLLKIITGKTETITYKILKAK